MSGWPRTIAFRVVFFGASVPVVLLAPIAALFGERALIRWSLVWIALHRVIARSVGGVRIRVEGPVPATPVLVAAKHHAMFETLELAHLLGGPVIVMKQELARIPVWGWVARRYGTIVIDRANSGAALRQMMREAAIARAKGRSVLLFPEGTRVPVGTTPPLKSGFAGLYRSLKMPVVPVALDTGKCWPRTGPMRPGTVTFRFGEPIPADLPRTEIEARVHAAINALETGNDDPS